MLKWGTLGSNRLKCTGYRWAPNLLKVGRLGPRCAKVRRSLHPAPTGASAKRASIHAASKVAKVGAAGGPKLLKWGRLQKKVFAPVRGRTKVANKAGPLRARVKSAKVRPTPYVYGLGPPGALGALWLTHNTQSTIKSHFKLTKS